MQEQEKIFANGFSFKRNEKAPDFVIGRMSLKVDDAIAFLKENEKRGYVNVNVKKARSGSFYVELDTFEPTSKGDYIAVPAPATDAPADDLPF